MTFFSPGLDLLAFLKAIVYIWSSTAHSQPSFEFACVCLFVANLSAGPPYSAAIPDLSSLTRRALSDLKHRFSFRRPSVRLSSRGLARPLRAEAPLNNPLVLWR